MLGSAVGSHPDVKYTGEVFCRNVPPNWERMAAIVNRVVCGGFKTVLLDVKYNQISEPVEELLRQIPVIHLIRRDIRRLYYSGELHTYYAQHPEAREAGEIVAFEIDEARFKRLKQVQRMHIKRFGYLEDLRLCYEGLTGNQPIERLPEEIERAICALLGVAHHPLVTGFRKNAPADIDDLLLKPKSGG